jgi:hypothetical protein
MYPSDELDAPKAMSQVYLDLINSITHSRHLSYRIFLLGFDFVTYPEKLWCRAFRPTAFRAAALGTVDT